MSGSSPDSHTIVFLGGMHRGGTTFLARALAGHPQASGFSETGAPEDEGEHLQSVYQDCWELGGVGRFGFYPEAHLTEESELVSDRSRELLWHQWSRWWDLDKPVLVEKSPPNMLKMRFLQALFPESRFVLILRHPVAVAGATLKWRPRFVREFAPHRLVRHWIACQEIAFADAPHVRNLHVLRYEDLIADADGALAELSSFVGLDEVVSSSTVESWHNERYLALWQELRGNPLRRAYLERIERRYEPELNRFGYSFSTLEPLFRAEEITGARPSTSPSRRPGR